MFEAVAVFILAVLAVILFFGTLPLIIALRIGDRTRLERLLDVYVEVFLAAASALLGVLEIFKPHERLPNRPPAEADKLPAQDEE